MPPPPRGRPHVPGRLYAVVWRWHFYAGLITAPILWVLTLTGALYVFRTELAAWRDRPLLVVEPQSTRLSYDTLREIAAGALGTDVLDAVAFTAEPDRSVAFVAEEESGGDHGAEHRHRRAFLDPYTGGVLGSRVDEEDFFTTVLELHRSLMMGTTGRILGELATSWGLVLLATGVFLWWPRGKANVGVWAPRLRGKPYAVLRDWHSVAGAYLVPLTAIVAATGLFFSAVWGTAFNTTVQKAGHWAPKWFSDAPSTPPTPDALPASLDQVIATVLEHTRPGDEAFLALAPSPDIAHKAWLIRDEDKNTFRMVSVDQYSGRAIDVVDAAELPFLYRVRLWAVSIHMGKIFGTPTKILALLASLALFGLSVTGRLDVVDAAPSGPHRVPAPASPEKPAPMGLGCPGLGRGPDARRRRLDGPDRGARPPRGNAPREGRLTAGRRSVPTDSGRAKLIRSHFAAASPPGRVAGRRPNAGRGRRPGSSAAMQVMGSA